ncbi:MAG: AsmA-like C-terminal region-containing protein [Deltaproteobacteria bacterium]|nr:AsmA-like C-terminal region-containing protein [Deltaproteobacteria bacterium]
MNLLRKRILLPLIACAVAFFGLFQAFNVLANKNRDQVHQELQRILGKEIYFEKLEASFFGGIGFAAKEFSVADHPRFAATPFVRARELLLGVSLWNLFRGRAVIDSLTFKDPEIQIITDETGLMNIFEFAKGRNEPRPSSRSRGAARKERPAVSLLITKMRLRNGRIEYIDRSTKEPAEMRVKNVEMDIGGLDLKGRVKFKFAAAVTEGLGHDVRIEGEWGPASRDLNWAQQPVNFDIQFDSLHVPVIARAIAFFRDKIPRELDVAGPLSLRAKLTGTLQEPRITGITLKVPLFGAPDYNAILEGAVAFSKTRTWEDAQIEGKLVVTPVSLAQLRNVKFLKQNLPADLAAEGKISVRSRFEGTWRDLRIGALIDADGSELRYRDWLHKPAKTRARLRAAISRRKNSFVLHESELSFGNSKMTVSGFTEETPQTRWQLRLRGQSLPVATLSRLFSPLPISGTRGVADWDIAINRNLAPNGQDWNLQGKLKLADAEFKHKENGRKIEKLNADISFLGDKAQVENAFFRLGSSTIALAGTMPFSAEISASYRLRSAKLDLTDLPELSFVEPGHLKEVTASGELRIQNGLPVIKGSVASPDGVLQGTSYEHLRAEVTWSPSGVSVKNLSLQAFNGALRANGYWAYGGGDFLRFEWASQMESMNLRDILAQKIPQLRDRIDGQLNLRGQLDTTAHKNATLRENLKGSGEVVIRAGAMRGFNLIAEIFGKGSGTLTPTRLPARLSEILTDLLARRDVLFDTLRANFTVDQQRIRSANLLLSTPDYEVAAAGWIAFDRTTRWNGLLVLSPRLSQEFLRDNRMIRYLMDRRERLTIPFRIDGTLPNVKARPDTRTIAQALRRGTAPRAPEPPPVREPRQEPNERREPLPEALEQLLRR